MLLEQLEIVPALKPSVICARFNPENICCGQSLEVTAVNIQFKRCFKGQQRSPKQQVKFGLPVTTGDSIWSTGGVYSVVSIRPQI